MPAPSHKEWLSSGERRAPARRLPPPCSYMRSEQSPTRSPPARHLPTDPTTPRFNLLSAYAMVGAATSGCDELECPLESRDGWARVDDSRRGSTGFDGGDLPATRPRRVRVEPGLRCR